MSNCEDFLLHEGCRTSFSQHHHPLFKITKQVSLTDQSANLVKYPIGFGEQERNSFIELYDNQTGRKEVYTVKLPESKDFLKQIDNVIELVKDNEWRQYLYQHHSPIYESEPPTCFDIQESTENFWSKKTHNDGTSCCTIC